ncbi:hypothetical protein CEUSTIGMA_g2383.t1 [Chlamydomonas eustigma]|uniref:Peptidase S8/S53 domain-containing protein n=1 Tax=Chlamydomonas eustigma TaxID=1157962 RepID=A0A250WVT4_9CHLO|nr:hypothetical protein CEUSTIGMA_g2383.t1 [Chlamydomonas eustigma]|eukprot:GAX74937.1 hypothetical protein CEUSTIGMA_g2383.t1 [Chlamydomonas eustigma]
MPDHLPGNYGTDVTQSSTISSPAVSKNCIAVGAGLTLQAGYQPTVFAAPVINAVLKLSTASGDPILTQTFAVIQASFGPQALSQLKGLSLLVVAAEPQDACEGLSKQVSMPGLSVLVVVQRGGCSFTQKSQAVQAAGATAAIITNDVDDGYFVLLPAVGVDVQGSRFNIPVMGVPLSTGRWLWAAAQNKGTISFSSYTASTNSYDSVASYSSFGPTPDGRIKPDLIAPGDTVSATTSGTLTGSLDGCGTTEMQGTSMATPVVAASAVMIRQYFMDGFYPSGVQTPGNKVNVSGVLVKAILMGGAISMQGSETLINPSTGQYQSLPLEAAPSSRQGWGRVDLTRSLPLPNSPLGWNLQVVDLAVLTQGQTHEYCVYATGGPLRITLAWFDYPADLNAPVVLVNNLDLQVTSSAMGGFVLLGNNQVDTLNTVEMVSLESMPRGSVNITVIASSIFFKASPQPYALVVLGMFSGVLVSGSNPMKGAATASLNAFNGNTNYAAGDTTCTATVALIQGTYPNVTSSAQVTFTFSSSTGSSSTSSTSPTNFQCMLSNVLSSQQLSTAGSNASSSANHVQQPLVLSVWTACTSPMSYTGLADGSYVFQVRPVGQPVTDSRMFTVDATPPKLSLSSTLSTSTLSPVLSLNSTSQDSIVLTFTVIDITPVTLSCAISVTNFGSVPPPYFRTSSMLINASGAVTSAGSVSWTGPCKSPLTLYGLYFGTWEVVVTGIDAADNVASTPPISWTEAFTSGVIYTRVAASPIPLTNKPNLSFTLYSFRGAGSSSPTLLDTSSALSYQYQLLLISNTSTPLTLPPTLSSLLPSSSWTAISMHSVINITVPSDGQYVFGARALAADGSIATSPDAEATAAVQVLTVPPVLVVVSGPPAVQSQTVVTIIFQTTSLSTDQVTYSCRWLFGYNTFPSADTLDVGGKAFTSCNGPTANSSTSGVDTGYWLFQVKAEDKAGNISPPLNVTFLTDTQAPIILASAPTATRLSRLGITSTIRSTIAGLAATVPHVANSTATSSCILTAKWTSGAPAISSNITSMIRSSSVIKSLNSSIAVGGDSSSPSLLDVVDGIAYSNTSALASSMAKATQGRVGNSLSPCPSPVLFDVQEGLYIFSLNATSAAGLSSDSTHIIVVDATSPVSQITTQFTSRPYPSQVSLGFISQDLPITYNSGINTSLCAINYTGASTKNGILAGGYNLLYNSWGPCVSPLVLSSLQTGLYTLQVKAFDNAGNMGLPASPLIFSVDDSLPLNSSATIVYSGASDTSGLNVLVIGIVAGVGSLLIAAIIIGVMVIRRSFRHLLDDGSDPVLLWSPPAAWLQQFSENHNDGASGVIDPARWSRNQRGRINGFSNLRSGGNGRDRALISIPGLGTLTTASMDEVILEEWERERTRQTIQASIEQEQLKTAFQRSLVVSAFVHFCRK